MDEDSGKDDLIGSARISFAKARTMGKDQMKAPVIAKNNKQHGFVQISLSFTKNSALVSNSRPPAAAMLSAGAIMQQVAPPLAGHSYPQSYPAVTSHPAQSSGGVMAAGELSFRLDFAKGLKDKDLFGKQDPFCIITCGQQQFKSHTHTDGGKNPVWNETFKFNIINENEVKLEVRDEDVAGSDTIGHATVSLAKARTSGSDCLQAPVMSKSGKQHGFIQVTMAFTKNSSLQQQQIHQQAPHAAAYSSPQFHPQAPAAGLYPPPAASYFAPSGGAAALAAYGSRPPAAPAAGYPPQQFHPPPNAFQQPRPLAAGPQYNGVMPPPEAYAAQPAPYNQGMAAPQPGYGVVSQVSPYDPASANPHAAPFPYQAGRTPMNPSQAPTSALYPPVSTYSPQYPSI
ncbi:hypothetical protein CEUSTIGMA_g8392.t1 [Chlamydomonas eustigma]|uniref:C2 domain-containing protein n=1 Tax=Chlamydomonas eustigma TaxID=1157962 RepID=A0A250XCZ1_9CHLO|nr:hypothetical protein CEUSTIGMA_g8392.t1 [Chlamydomonas eustigma]|eukprot:GAX80957.1 hypothetical protein CEUSTIGMA_g8392.t1 [Chlamydomonas eustigma]